MDVYSETFDFFLKSQFSLLELCDHQVVGKRTVEFLMDLFVEFVMLIREFLDMRL